MNDATLQMFRDLADAMQTEPQTWQWIGPHLSQRMFGITEKRAKAFAANHGGVASLMVPDEVDDSKCPRCGGEHAWDGRSESSRYCGECRMGE